MRLESTQNKYEYKGNYNYPNSYDRNDKYKFSNKYYNPKQNNEVHYKELEKGKNFGKQEELYNQNSYYNYKKRDTPQEKAPEKEGDEQHEPKLRFTNSKKLEEDSNENFKQINQEGDVRQY